MHRQCSLGFVTCHLVGEDAVEQGPDARHIVLRGRHVDVDRPQVPTFRVGINDPLEYCFPAFGVAKFVLELSEF